MTDGSNKSYTRFHLVFGWWSLLAFLSLGIGLECMTLFKLSWYSAPEHEVRRLMWRLGHAHGTLLSVVHIAFAITLWHSATLLPSGATLAGWQKWGSKCLLGASFLLPGGFLAGGIYHFEGDPGPGVFVVPIGALLLLCGVLLVARGAGGEAS